MSHRYKLDTGTQVREEDFGLLFYTHKGPKLYFLPSGKLLSCEFFQDDITLTQWMENSYDENNTSADQVRSLRNALNSLVDRGVIIEY